MGPYAGVDYIISPYVDFRFDSNTCTIRDPMIETTLTLCQSQLYPPVRAKNLASVKKSWVHESIKPAQTSNSAYIYRLQFLNFKLGI
jgi:hypothetical protein